MSGLVSSIQERKVILTEHTGTSGDPVKIKKYANRRLYNTETSQYVTLEDLAAMARDRREFVVIDARNGNDLTHCVLTQIIIDQEAKGESLLPIGFLRQLIQFYGQNIERLVPSYLEYALQSLISAQDELALGIAGGGALDFDRLKRHATATMAQFGREVGKTPSTAEAGDDAVSYSVPASDIDALRIQLAAMQKQLDKLSGR